MLSIFYPLLNKANTIRILKNKIHYLPSMLQMSPPRTGNDDKVPNISVEAENVANSFSELSTQPPKINVSTLVFFDIETTGLACKVGKENVQITEISMIAVDRTEFSKCEYPDLRDIRVVHKLSLCVRPKCSISQEAAKLTGLSDNNLQIQQTFDENTATIIVSFLSHLPKPVCLLAHNGKLFDYPILKAEFEKINKHFPSDLNIVDTLACFKNIGIPDLPFSQKLHKDVKFKLNGGVSFALQNLHLYFFGKNHVGSHSSEGDCIALAKVCHKLRDKMLPWMDENCFTFDTIKALW